MRKAIGKLNGFKKRVLCESFFNRGVRSSSNKYSFGFLTIIRSAAEITIRCQRIRSYLFLLFLSFDQLMSRNFSAVLPNLKVYGWLKNWLKINNNDKKPPELHRRSPGKGI